MNSFFLSGCKSTSSVRPNQGHFLNNPGFVSFITKMNDRATTFVTLLPSKVEHHSNFGNLNISRYREPCLISILKSIWWKIKITCLLKINVTKILLIGFTALKVIFKYDGVAVQSSNLKTSSFVLLQLLKCKNLKSTQLTNEIIPKNTKSLALNLIEEDSSLLWNLNSTIHDEICRWLKIQIADL